MATCIRRLNFLSHYLVVSIDSRLPSWRLIRCLDPRTGYLLPHITGGPSLFSGQSSPCSERWHGPYLRLGGTAQSGGREYGPLVCALITEGRGAQNYLHLPPNTT
jgi:hypothetical protein